MKAFTTSAFEVSGEPWGNAGTAGIQAKAIPRQARLRTPGILVFNASSSRAEGLRIQCGILVYPE